MSLLNDMLKDIEKKKALDAKEAIITPTLNSGHWSRQFHRYLRLIVSSVVLANVMVGLAIFVTKNRQSRVGQQPITIAKTVDAESLRTVRISSLTAIGKLQDKPQRLALNDAFQRAPVVGLDDIKKESKLSKREQSIKQYRLALQFIDKGQSDVGTGLLEDIVVSDPSYYDAWHSLIMLDMKNKKTTQALARVEKASQVFPQSLALLQSKATLLMQSGRYKESITELLQRRPKIEDAPEFYALLAALYEKINDSLKAGEIYQMLVQIYPDKANYWLGFALALENTHHLNQAFSAYQKVLEGYSTDPVITAYARERINKLRG